MVKGKSAYQTIAALPAEYAGVTFRSRLEARWAYYFDLIGLPWQYEPEGFPLEAGNYCPDFRCFNYHVEVKPTLQEMIVVIPKLIELSKVTDGEVFCVVGDPTTQPQRGWCRGHDNGTASFCAYAFTSKGWELPYACKEYEDQPDEWLAVRARSLHFNRGGLAEADWEVLRARNIVIEKRRAAYKKAQGMETAERAEFFQTEIKMLDARLVSLNKVAGL